MGFAILVLWFMSVLAGVLLARQRFEQRALGWGIRLGLLITVIGMLIGVLMTGPTPDQLSAMEAGAPVTVLGAHTVGAADGGTMMPVTGWSLDGGDLRIPHFVGIHAMQLLPLVGWWLSRRNTGSRRRPVAMTSVVAGGYAGLVALLTWQALRGQPLIYPDALTLGLVAVLIVAVVVGLAVAWRATQSPSGKAVGAPAAASREVA